MSSESPPCLTFESPPCLRVTWTIPDFFRLATGSGYSLQSPDFTFDDGRYCLRLFQTDYLGSDCIDIELQNLIHTDPGRALLYEVQFRSGNEDIDMYRVARDKQTFWNFRSEVERQSDLSVPDGVMTVLCSVRLAKPNSAGNPKSGGAQTRVIPTYRMIGELSSESPPFLYVMWTVSRFFQLSRESRYTLESPQFPFSDHRYCLRLVPKWNCVAIHLVNLTKWGHERYVSYDIGLKSTSGEEIDIDHFGTSITPEFYISRSDLDLKKSDCFPDGHLIVFCCVRATEPSSVGSPTSSGTATPGSKAPVPQAAAHLRSVGVQTSSEEEDKEGFPGMSKLVSDLRHLLQKVPDSDACLVVCGKEFRAHQNILRARSPVFDAMFGHETAERESGRVVIDDLDQDSFGHFLEYPYTGGVGAGISQDNAFGLYQAADKYDVPTLKEECVEYMRRSLSVDSFCDVLSVALQHKEEELLSRAVTFFKENMVRIIVTVKWQQFVIDNGTSANELFIKAVVPAEQ